MLCVYLCSRLKESGAINTSLFMLSEVVDALNKQKVIYLLHHLLLSYYIFVCFWVFTLLCCLLFNVLNTGFSCQYIFYHFLYSWLSNICVVFCMQPVIPYRQSKLTRMLQVYKQLHHSKIVLYYLFIQNTKYLVKHNLHVSVSVRGLCRKM